MLKTFTIDISASRCKGEMSDGSFSVNFVAPEVEDDLERAKNSFRNINLFFLALMAEGGWEGVEITGQIGCICGDPDCPSIPIPVPPGKTMTHLVLILLEQIRVGGQIRGNSQKTDEAITNFLLPVDKE